MVIALTSGQVREAKLDLMVMQRKIPGLAPVKLDQSAVKCWKFERGLSESFESGASGGPIPCY